MSPSIAIRRTVWNFNQRVVRARKVVASAIPGFIEHSLFLGGLGSIAFGGWEIYRPLGPILGGAFAIWVSFLSAAERNSKT